MFFKNRTYFDEETVNWHFAVWEWLLENFGGFPAFLETKLITPSQENFPYTPSYDHSYFEEVFSATKDFMGLKEWPCILERIEDEGDIAGEIRIAKDLEGDWSSDGPAGTFEITDKQVIIRYSPQLAHDPVGLVATMAHELSHYLLASADTDPPEGWEDHELHTDVATIFAGFGIFQSNSAFSFQQSDEGWSTSRQGYLPESELAYSLAIFATLAEIETKPITRLLKPNSRSYFKKAIKDIQGRAEQIRKLQSIK